MASNGHLSIFARSSPPLTKMGVVQARGRIISFGLIAAISAAALSMLPFPLFLALAAAGLCLLLIPSTPLVTLVILLTLAPLRTLIATEAGLALPLDIGQLLFALYLAVLLAFGIIRRWRIPALSPEPVLLGAVALCALLALGVWTSDSIGNWLTEWLKWVVVAIMIWHLPQVARRNWRWLIFAVLVGAVANAIVGLYIFFGGSGADHLLILGRYFRAFGTYGQPNPFGGFMGIASPLALAWAAISLYQMARDLLAGRRIGRRRIVTLAASSLALALILAALIASWSRGAWLGFAVSLAVMLVALPRRALKGIGYAASLALLFGALWFAGVIPTSVVNRLTTAATDLFTISDVRGIEFYPWNYAVVERLAHWQAAIGMAQEHPLFGVGLGNYAAAYDEFRLINWEAPLGHAHNLYLNFLAEAGIVGLSAYLIFWLVVFRITWSARRHPDRRARVTVIGLLGCWTYIAVHSIFDNLFVNNLFLHIGVLLSVLAILHREVTDSLIVE